MCKQEQKCGYTHRRRNINTSLRRATLGLFFVCRLHVSQAVVVAARIARMVSVVRVVRVVRLVSGAVVVASLRVAILSLF